MIITLAARQNRGDFVNDGELGAIAGTVVVDVIVIFFWRVVELFEIRNERRIEQVAQVGDELDVGDRQSENVRNVD